MIKEYTSNTAVHIHYISRKEIENLYWYIKCNNDVDMFEIRLIPGPIGTTKQIRLSGQDNTILDVTDYSIW